VTGNDGVDLDYYTVSMAPANWYQWFDPAQPADDKEWETVSQRCENTLNIATFIIYACYQ